MSLPAPRAYSVVSPPVAGAQRITPDPELVSYPTFSSQPKTAEEFYARADQVAELLHKDEAVRDRGNVVPYRQVQLLKDAGLVNLLGPQEFGGGGQKFDVAFQVVRIIARGDGSLGQLLGYHYVWFWAVNLLGSEAQIKALQAHATKNKLFFGGAVNPRDSDVNVIQDPQAPDTLIFNGKKSFSTGSKVSDLTIVEGVFPAGQAYAGQHVFAAVPSKQEGIVYGDEWVDTLGMRGTQSGGISFTNVRFPFAEGFGWAKQGEGYNFTPLGPYNTVNLPLIQLVFAAFYLGITEGALARGLAYTRETTRAWPFVPEHLRVSRGTDEAYIQIDYGLLQSKVWAAAALVEKAIEEGVPLLHISKREELSATARGEWAVHIAAAKLVVAETGLEVTTKVWELQGARSIAAKYGLDVAGRDLRTHILHDPIAHKKAEVGRFALHGVPDGLPAPSWYT